MLPKHTICLKKLIYDKNELFCCILAVFATKLRNAGKTFYLSKKLKYVKKWLFW
ncbi:hypothetical protein E2C01_040122 [Portunus trituberculatus]|uniref:Uncharacterized protein n=1 Tax=Portunus trituberculatus TaxID=210409 RepID=A0A5B7FIU3_PORTR|nr:hypothetical protein [Portunus trituberculatus]